MKNVPRNVRMLAEKHAREAFPAPVHDAQLHAALGDSTMFLAAVSLYAQVGDPSGEKGMDFYDCAKHVMQLGEEFKRAAHDLNDEMQAAETARREAAWVAANGETDAERAEAAEEEARMEALADLNDLDTPGGDEEE